MTDRIVAFSLRIPSDVLDAIDAIAADQGTSRNAMIVQTLSSVARSRDSEGRRQTAESEAMTALRVGYMHRYEAATDCAWMTSSRSHTDIATVARWAVAQSARTGTSVADVVSRWLDAVFADSSLAARSWPWSWLSTDPARYAHAAVRVVDGAAQIEDLDRRLARIYRQMDAIGPDAQDRDAQIADLEAAAAEALSARDELRASLRTYAP